MIKRNLVDYALYKIRMFEREFGVDVEIDWVELSPNTLFGYSAGYFIYDKTGEKTIFVPRTRDKEDFDEFLFHEIGHAVFEKLAKSYLPKKLSVETDIMYFFKSFLGAIGKRKNGYCSSYSEVNLEEEFCELLSFVLINRGRKRFYKFNGEVIDLLSDKILLKKVRRFEKLLWR